MVTSAPVFPVSFLAHPRRHSLLFIAVLGSFLTFSFPVAAAVEWTIKDLGNLGGDDQQALAVEHMAYGINNQGQVVGRAVVPPQIIAGVETYHFLQAFVSAPNGGALTNLQNADAPEAMEWGSLAMDINDSGQVIFRVTRYQALPASLSSAPPYTQADPIGLGYFVVARDINNLGQVVGQDYSGSFIYDVNSGEYAVSPVENPIGINDAGQILVDKDDGTYIWTQESGMRLVTSEDATGARSVAINNSGQIIGYERTEHKTTAYITGPDGTELSYLDTLGGDFTDVMGLNELGQVVGQSQTEDGIYHAFFTGANGQGMTDLESLQDIMNAGWSDIRVADINDFGQIAGTGTHNGLRRPFLLTPVPEPETYAMMLAGLSILGFMRRRQTKSLCRPIRLNSIVEV